MKAGHNLHIVSTFCFCTFSLKFTALILFLILCSRLREATVETIIYKRKRLVCTEKRRNGLFFRCETNMSVPY